MTLTDAAVVTCKVEGCDRRAQSVGWCGSHYNQWYRTGAEPTVPFTDAGRFYRYVNKSEPDDCWLWTGTIKRRNGYGQFWFDGKPQRAHRVSYRLSKGPIPRGLLVRHTCDVRACVNPKHLLLGTTLDNARDELERGRYPRGEKQGRAKLTEQQVTAIRKLRAQGMTQKAIAERFGVSRSNIQWILKGRTWSGIGEVA